MPKELSEEKEPTPLLPTERCRVPDQPTLRHLPLAFPDSRSKQQPHKCIGAEAALRRKRTYPSSSKEPFRVPDQPTLQHPLLAFQDSRSKQQPQKFISAEAALRRKRTYPSSSNGAVPSTRPAHAATSTFSFSRQPLSVETTSTRMSRTKPQKK